MKSRRLTKVLIEQIERALIKDLFSAEDERLKKEAQALAEEIYGHVYPTPFRQAMMKFPQGAFDSSTYITVELQKSDGSYINRVQLPLRKPRRTYACHRYTAVTIREGEKFFERVRSVGDSRAALGRSKTLIERKLRDACRGRTTTKQLVEAWPEAAKYLPPDDRVEISKNLPATKAVEELEQLINKLKGGK